MTSNTSLDSEWKQFLLNSSSHTMSNVLLRPMETKEETVVLYENKHTFSSSSSSFSMHNTSMGLSSSSSSSMTSNTTVEKHAPPCEDLYISTKTKVIYLNRAVDTERLFWELPILEYWKREEGIIRKQTKIISSSPEELAALETKLRVLRDEQHLYCTENVMRSVNTLGKRNGIFKDERKITVGLSKKDIMNCRGKVKKAFMNCVAVLFRFYYDNTFKEMHVKIFNTGKMEIPGILTTDILNGLKVVIKKSLEPFFAREDAASAAAAAAALIVAKGKDQATQNENENENTNANTKKTLEFIENAATENVLINSNFNCGFCINKDRLYAILRSEKYGIEITNDPCHYPGLKCKYYFKGGVPLAEQNGRVSEEDRQLTVSELEASRRYTKVSFMIFRTGSCLILGNCSEEMIRHIYDFLRQMFVAEYAHIVAENESAVVKTKKNKPRKRKIEMSTEYYTAATASASATATAASTVDINVDV